VAWPVGVALVLVSCGAEAVPPFDPYAEPDAIWDWCEAAYDQRAAGTMVEEAADAEALAGVELVGGDLVISGPLLNGVTALSDLRCVRGDLRIESNGRLVDLAGLEGLVFVGGELEISVNSSLIGVPGLSGLQVVGRDVEVVRNERLRSVDGLSALVAVHGELDVFDNAALGSVAGLDALETLGGRLSVRSNESLERISLRRLRETDVERADGGATFRGVEITGNEALTQIELPLLEATGHLDVTENPALRSVDLSGLQRVEGGSSDVFSGGVIVVSDALEAIDLSNLTSLSGRLRVDGPPLTRLSAPRLRAVVGDVHVGEEVRSVPQRIATLETLDLASLTEVGGDLRIQNTAIESLEGLGSLSSVEGTLEVEHNPVLRSLVGLESVTHIGWSLAIASNRSLPQCEALALEQRLIEEGAFDGSARIAANDETATCD